MRCRDFDEAISAGLPVPIREPGAARHLAECDVCRHLIETFDDGARSPTLTERQVKRLQVGIGKNVKSVRPLPPSRFFLVACAIVFSGIVAVGAMRLGINGWAALTTFQRIAVFATLAVSARLVTASVVGQMIPGSKLALAPAALPAAILFTLAAVIGTMFRPKDELAFVTSGLSCMKSGFTLSILAAFLFWLSLRRGAMLYPRLFGAAQGTLAGLTGVSVLELNCPNLNVFHILVWHWGVVLVSAGAGALLGAAAEYFGRTRDQKAS